MSATVTKTETANSKIKDKDKHLKDALQEKNLDNVLEKVKKIDNVCSFAKCKTKTTDFAIECKHCNNRFCTSHGLPEIHGCGEAVRRDERRKFVHPEPHLSNTKHEEASTKLAMKLKQMELQRKSKQGYKEKGKKK